MLIQHPFAPNDTIQLDALMELIDHEYEMLRDVDSAAEFGHDVTGDLNKLLNTVQASLSRAHHKAAFIVAATERYVGT